MKRENNPLILCLFGILPVMWLGLLIAPAVHGGLPEIVARFPAAMNDPFHIELCRDSLKTVLVLLCAYGLTVGVILSSRRNYRRGEEHGSAKWGSARTVNRKYRAAAPEDNKIFTQNVRMGLDGRKHRRNLNTVVVGGSGAGKTRFYAKPNLCQANTSFTVLDPKGELLRSTGHLLRQKGYEVRVLDLLNMEQSHCYNPFVYLRDDNDVQRLVTNLFKSTTPKGSQSNDPFWDTAASMLLLALIFYIHSLKQGETHVLGEATILKRLGDNDYLAEYNGVKCHAIFNPFAGRYFVDDVYGVIRSLPDRDSR